MFKIRRKLTGSASAVWLDKGRCDLAVLHLQGIALASDASKDGGSIIKSEIKGLCEFSSGIGNEPNLCMLISYLDARHV